MNFDPRVEGLLIGLCLGFACGFVYGAIVAATHAAERINALYKELWDIKFTP